jgi:hypothetical protein
MKWNISRSEEIKKKIASNEDLMRKLSETVESTLKRHEIMLGPMSYVFEPRVFNFKPDEAVELTSVAHDAMIRDLIVDLHKKGMLPNIAKWSIDKFIPRKCIPECGIIDPTTLRILEKYRIADKLYEGPIISDDPVPIAERFMKQIVGNKALLTELSDSMFKILNDSDIKLKQGEGCVFTPMIYEKPVYAQRISLPKAESLSGFSPQIFADPTPEPAILRLKPLPGIIDIPRIGPTPGIVIDRLWWWIGIPAPEMLSALDIMRNR